MVIMSLIVINVSQVSAEEPPFGQPTLFQVTLNKVAAEVPLNIAGKKVVVTFEGDVWRGRVNGKDAMAGDCIIEENEDGAVITLTVKWVYSDKKNPLTKQTVGWIENPSKKTPNVVLDYKEGPPAALTPRK